MKKAFYLITLSLSFMVISCDLTVTGQDWPQWRGMNRDGKVEGFKAPDKWPSELKVQWKIKVGYGDATPALVNGKLFVFTRIGGNEVLQCLDASSGEKIWENSYPADEVTGPAARHPGPRSTPTVSGGKVAIIGATGIISCIDAASGKLLWRNNEYENLVPVYFTGMSPIILENKCIAHLGESDRSAVIAFDLNSGNILWKHEGEAPAYGSPDEMLFDNEKMVVLQTDSMLIGLSAGNGEKLWEIPAPPESRYYNSSSPVIDGHRIFYSGQGHGTGAVMISKEEDSYSVNELWRNSEYGTNYNTPVLKDGYLFGLNERGYLFCLDASDGKLAWADTTRHRDFGSIIDIGSELIALPATSNLIVYQPDSKEYSQKAFIPVSETPIYAHPVLTGNKIYIKNEESLILYITGK
ncbi:MAG: PQQ-binding-like beta-propeller repeat protein [Bacteroidales bacterium]|nr:PQQ-binding-like beta-propeller repeat protein [Bacteroidales bacterium]